MEYSNTIPFISAIHPSSDWCEIEHKKTYVHEAGHAVVARLTGCEVAWVSVDYKFMKSDPIAIAQKRSPNFPTCMTFASKRLNPILNKRKALNKQEKEIVIGYCMQVLAGPFAEYHLDPESFNNLHSVNDFQQVYSVLQALEPNKKRNKELFLAAKRRLVKLLNEHWSSIVRVADALHQRSTLTGADIDHIMQISDIVENCHETSTALDVTDYSEAA